jgi:hypothetical protein
MTHRCPVCGSDNCCCPAEPKPALPPITSPPSTPPSRKKYRVCTRHVTSLTYEVEADSPEQAKVDAFSRALRRLHRGRTYFEAHVEVDTPQELW